MKEAERRQAILRRLAGMESNRAHLHPIPTGFAALDEVAGGGLPRGAMVEVFGPAGCGKTTLALQVAAHLQRGGQRAAWIDADHTFDAGYAASLGVKLEEMPVAQPDTAEEAIEVARTLAASGAVDLVAIDSAAALTPRLEFETGIGQSVPGLQSRVLGSELRKLSGAIWRSECCLLFLNQIRNAPQGETSAGGPALKFFAAVRISMQPVNSSRVRLQALKNKAAEGAARGDLEWRRGSGFTECP
jgi:recombination protein RecA